MSMENYSVAVKLSLVENVSKGLIGLAGHFTMLNRQATAFQARLSALKSQAAIGGTMIVSGAAIAAPILYAVTQAGNLQKQLAVVKLATGASADEMERFRQTVDKVATSTMFKSVEIGAMAKMLSTANTFTAQQVESLLPSFANFALTQKTVKGTDIKTSTEQAIKLAEITGHFTPESIKGTLDAYTKLSLLMPGSVDKVLGAFAYAEGTMKNVMHVSDENSLLMVAFLQRMGIQGTRAGSQLIATITRTIPQVFGSGLWTGNSHDALVKMGMLAPNGTPDVFTKGAFDPTKLMSHLSLFVRKEFTDNKNDPATAISEIQKTFQDTFGGSSRMAAIFSNPDAIKELLKMSDAFAKFPNLEAITQNLQDLFGVQLPAAASNIGTLFTSLGTAILPQATDSMKVFNDQISRLIAFVDTHQAGVGKFEMALLGIASLSVVGGVLLLLRAGVMGLIIPFQIFTGTFAVLTGITGIALAPLVGMGVALGLIAVWGYKAYQALTSLSLADIGNAIKTLGETTLFMIQDFFQGMVNSVKRSLGIKVEGDDKTQMFNDPEAFNRSMAQKYPNSPDGIAYRKQHPDVQAPQARSYNATMLHGTKSPISPTNPIHVHVNVDGRQVATAVIDHVHHNLMTVPNSASTFDGNLSPMPTIANAVGMA